MFGSEFQREGVALPGKGDKDVAQLAREFCIKCTHLYRWKEELETHGRRALAGHGKRNPQTSTDEKVRLRAKNRRLKEESEILEKAAIYFAKESARGLPLLLGVAIDALLPAFV